MTEWISIVRVVVNPIAKLLHQISPKVVKYLYTPVASGTYGSQGQLGYTMSKDFDAYPLVSLYLHKLKEDAGGWYTTPPGTILFSASDIAKRLRVRVDTVEAELEDILRCGVGPLRVTL